MARTGMRSRTGSEVKMPEKANRKEAKRSRTEESSKAASRPCKATRKSSTPRSPSDAESTTARSSFESPEADRKLESPKGDELRQLESEFQQEANDVVAISAPVAEAAVCDAYPELPQALRDLEGVVISLERRPDRYQDCVARFQACCPWLNYSFFRATDGKIDPISESECTLKWNTGKNVVYQKRRSIRKGWDDLDSYAIRDLPMSAGERGCGLSHIRAWRLCLERGDRPLLVLEDDAAPTPEFTTLLTRAMADTPKDAHVLYLGYSQAVEWRREVTQDVVESEYVWTTVGYIVWPAGARILLDRCPVDGPVDNFMALACAEGPLKSYAIRPKIIRQADAWNANSDVAHSDECYWGADSDIKHSDDFYWGPATAAEREGPASGVSGAAATAESNAVGGGRLPFAGGSLTWDIDSDDSDDNPIE